MPEAVDAPVDGIAPLTETELAALPLFPLPRVVLFPGSVLPLHVFEPRYRELMEACVAEGPMAMAVPLLVPGWEQEYDGRPPIHPIAGAGRIVEHRRYPDGRFDVLLAGLARVRLQELPAEGRSYRRAHATPLVDRTPHPERIAEQIPAVLSLASTVVALVRERYPEFSLGVDGHSHPSVIADRIADRLVSSPEGRQRLLEALDVKVRLALARDALLEVLTKLRAEGHGGAVH